MLKEQLQHSTEQLTERENAGAHLRAEQGGEELTAERAGGTTVTAAGSWHYLKVYIAFPEGEGNPIFLFMEVVSLRGQWASKHLKH